MTFDDTEEQENTTYNVDLQMLNILVNNKKELRDFVTQFNEYAFEQRYVRFAKHLISYLKAYNSCPTLSTLIEYCNTNNNSNLEGYITDVWSEVEDNGTDSREYSFILNKIKERRNRILISTFIQDTSENIDSLDSRELVELNNRLVKLTNEIRSLKEKRVYTEISMKTGVEAYVNKLRAKGNDPALTRGIMTGFSTFDYYTNGIRKGELGVIVADSGGGKSIFLDNLAKNVYLGTNVIPTTNKQLKEMIETNSFKDDGKNVLLISLEMPADEVEDRVMSSMAEVDSLNLSKGPEYITEEESKRLSIALKFRQHYEKELKIVDVPRGCSMAQVQRIYDDICAEFIPDLVIIDYLGLMTDGGEINEQDWEKLKNIAEQMHEFARVNEVAVFTAVQAKCSKPGEGGVGLHRIGRSSMILHNANIALQIENRENEDMRPDARIHCIKFRRGPKFIMSNLRKEFVYNRFADAGFTEEQRAPKQEGKLGEDLSSVMALIEQDDSEHEAQQEQE